MGFPRQKWLLERAPRGQVKKQWGQWFDGPCRKEEFKRKLSSKWKQGDFLRIKHGKGWARCLWEMRSKQVPRSWGNTRLSASCLVMVLVIHRSGEVEGRGLCGFMSLGRVPRALLYSPEHLCRYFVLPDVWQKWNIFPPSFLLSCSWHYLSHSPTKP